MPINDLCGRTFGRLTIPTRAEPVIRNRKAYWPAVCECGAQKYIRGTKLTDGSIVSCGCWRADPDIRQAAAMAMSRKDRQARARTARRAQLTAPPS